MGGHNLNDLTGQRFGRWTVRCRDYSRGQKQRKAYWICDCDCGNTKSIRGTALVCGNSKSCGCFRIENGKNINLKHGDTGSRLYETWNNMKDRCFNTRHKFYHDYGGRGITVCNEWKNSYEEFKKWALANGYADNLTIDRVNVDGDYEPNNCRWTTMKVQSNNRRSNSFLEYDGKRLTYSQWEEALGLRKRILTGRVKRGMDIEEAFELKFSESLLEHFPMAVVRTFDNKYYSSRAQAYQDKSSGYKNPNHSDITKKIRKGDGWRMATKEEVIQNDGENSPAMERFKYLEKFGRVN